MALPTPTDNELLRLMMAGEEAAFVTLYRRRQGGVYRFAWQMSGSSAIAEEVTQEVFLALIGDPRQYDPARGTLSGYLYGIARHQVWRCLERDRRRVSIEEEEPWQAPAQEDPLSELARRERIETVRRAVLALPMRYREVVVLCDLEEMGYAETAATLGCAVGTIRSRLHRARALLAGKLAVGLRAGHASRCLV